MYAIAFYIDYRAWWDDTLNWSRVTITVVDFDAVGKPHHVLAVLQDVGPEKNGKPGTRHRLLLKREEARLASIAKSEFLRRISHDLRTPHQWHPGATSIWPLTILMILPSR